MSEGPPKGAQEAADSLPEGLAGAAARGLDLDRALSGADSAAPTPPLEFPDRSFDLIWSFSAFGALAETRAEWQREVARLLDAGGLFLARLPVAAERGMPAGAEWLSLRRVPDSPSPAGDGVSAFLKAIEAGRRDEIDALREEFHRETARRSLRIAELEADPGSTPGSWAIAERVAAAYEGTLSWRLTRPVRAARRVLGRR